MPETVRSIDPVYITIGHRLRVRRSIMGISRQRLAQTIGLSLEQIRRYEAGLVEVRTSRLNQLSAALDVPAGYFFSEN